MELMKDDKDTENKEYILQDDKGTKGTITFLVIGIIILIVAVIISGYAFGFFGEEVIVE